MFNGFHVTRRTRKDSNGKAVAFVSGMAATDGADGVKKSGKGEAVDLYVRPIKLPESVEDVIAMCDETEWLEPAEKVAFGFKTDDEARRDGDTEHKRENTPRIVALLVNAIKLERNARTNAEVAPKGMVKANRSKAEQHWAKADPQGYVAMVIGCAGDDKVKNAKLDEYFAENLAE
jgi:hypothetical protein